MPLGAAASLEGELGAAHDESPTKRWVKCQVALGEKELFILV